MGPKALRSGCRWPSAHTQAEWTSLADEDEDGEDTTFAHLGFRGLGFRVLVRVSGFLV